MSHEIHKILIVDNEAEFVKTVARHLKREGFTLTMATDGEDAKRQVAAALPPAAFDLVITDVIMPKVDGIELLAWLKLHYPAISVLMVSGLGELNLVSSKIRPSMDDCRPKPITPQEMMAVIATINQKRAACLTPTNPGPGEQCQG